MNTILLDFKENWLNLLPLSFTRPVGKFRIGIFTINEKWEKYLNTECSYITEDYLSEKYPAKIEEHNLIINSIILPDKNLAGFISKLNQHDLLISGDLFIAANVSPDEVEKIRNQDLSGFRQIQYTGEVTCIKKNWDIFLHNASEIRKDVELVRPGITSHSISKTNVIIGNPDDLIIEEGVWAECVVFNVTDGPIYIGKDAILMEGSMLKGPVAIGEHSMVKMGAKIYQGTTIGPYCRAGGEINNSVFFGYSNKSHDGFLGQAVLGEWCNIGADSNNSNLKNNYDEVKVWNYKEKCFMGTGLIFCGLFMGDHSKCAINTMFNTGTTVGVSANIFGCGFPRTFIPSFTWGGASGFIDYDIEKALETARIVMSRRNIELDKIEEKILRTIFERTIEFRK
jgi:UDP-N-acetylglucosamine diphosphorylase/glucosamine-1-phosphate N-acetyltransferase